MLVNKNINYKYETLITQVIKNYQNKLVLQGNAINYLKIDCYLNT